MGLSIYDSGWNDYPIYVNKSHFANAGTYSQIANVPNPSGAGNSLWVFYWHESTMSGNILTSNGFWDPNGNIHAVGRNMNLRPALIV